MKMAQRSFLAPALLWLMMVRGTEGAEGVPQESHARALDNPRPFLPAPEKRRERPEGGPWGSEKNTLEPLEKEGGARPTPARPTREARRISGVLEKSFQISATALVLAAFCGWGVLLPFCQPQKLQIRGKAWKWLSIYANGLACLASALALVALTLWSYEKEFPAIFIVPIILLLHVILVTALVVVTITFQLDVLHQITDRAAQRMLDFTTPGGVMLVIVISGLLMKCISQLQEEEHAEPIDLTAVVAGAGGMCLLPAIIIVTVHCVDAQKRAEEERISQRKKWREAVQQEKNGLL